MTKDAVIASKTQNNDNPSINVNVSSVSDQASTTILTQNHCNQKKLHSIVNQNEPYHGSLRNENGQFICNECNRVFARKDHLKSHVKGIHNKNSNGKN